MDNRIICISCKIWIRIIIKISPWTENREFVLAPKGESAIYGFDMNTGDLIQLKNLDAYDQIMGRINETYSSGSKHNYLGIELFIKYPSTKSSALRQYKMGLKQRNVKLKGDGVISSIIVYCTDGKIALQLPKKKHENTNF